MAAFKNKANGTWYVQFRYTDWKGERQQKFKAWLCHQEGGPGVGTGVSDAKAGRCEHDL